MDATGGADIVRRTMLVLDDISVLSPVLVGVDLPGRFTCFVGVSWRMVGMSSGSRMLRNVVSVGMRWMSEDVQMDGTVNYGLVKCLVETTMDGMLISHGSVSLVAPQLLDGFIVTVAARSEVGQKLQRFLLLQTLLVEIRYEIVFEVQVTLDGAHSARPELVPGGEL